MTKVFNFFSKLVSTVKYSLQKEKNKKKKEPVVGLSLKLLHFDSYVNYKLPKPVLIPVVPWHKIYPPLDRCSLLSSSLGTSDYDLSDESVEEQRNVKLSPVVPKVYPPLDRCSLLSASLGTSDYDFSEESFEERRDIENISFDLNNMNETLFSRQSPLSKIIEDEPEMEFTKNKWTYVSSSMITLSSFIEIIEVIDENLQVYMALEDEVLCEVCHLSE